jgi:predicted transcriptional regulator of viral defense system
MPDYRKDTMRQKYCDWERVFEFVWKNADRDGMWGGDDATVASEFGVTEDEAHEVLGELCERGHVERIYPGTYAVVNWPERDEETDEE